MKVKEIPKGLSRNLWAVLMTALFLEVTALGFLGRLHAEEAKNSQDAKGDQNSISETNLLLNEKIMGLEEKSAEGMLSKEERENYRKELLRRPKRDRLRFGGDFDITYDTNVVRRVIRSEKEDTTFGIKPFGELDLSTKRIDLRTEFRWNGSYRAKVSEGTDSMSWEIAVRSGKKIGRRINLSMNNRLTRSGQRDTSIDDGKKITFDNSHQAALNYELNRKITFNFDSTLSRTDFPHENFDQDGTYQLQLSPNMSLQLTRKTKVTLGYRWTYSRTKVKTSDSRTDEFRLGYSGKITGKSTLSVDLTQSFQHPDSARATTQEQTSTSVGYVWQATPKTSLRLQYSNTLGLSISDSVSGQNLLKSWTRSQSDTWSTSIRFKLNRKISTEFSSNISHSHSKTVQTGADNTRSRIWTFPFQTAVDVSLAKWVRLRFTYTFRHQIGNEESNENRSHTWFVGTNISL